MVGPVDQEVGFTIPRLLGCSLVEQTSAPAGTLLMYSVFTVWNLSWKEIILSLPNFSLHIANYFGLVNTVLLFLSSFFILAYKQGMWEKSLSLLFMTLYTKLGRDLENKQWERPSPLAHSGVVHAHTWLRAGLQFCCILSDYTQCLMLSCAWEEGRKAKGSSF